jgi:hypothetical protein
MERWQRLKDDLQKEAASIFKSSGEVVEVKPDTESNVDLSLNWKDKAKHMRLTYIPRNNSVRWETAGQKGFLPVPEGSTRSLAVDLMKLLFRR